MSTNCLPAPANKKEYITDVGKFLVKKYGKKSYYSPKEVNKAHAKSKWSDEVDPAWAMSAFSSQLEFDRYHSLTGQELDYAGMKKEIFEGMSTWERLQILEQPLRRNKRKNKISWLDFGEGFGQVLFAILEFIGGLI